MMFHTARAVDEDEERRLDDENKIWFEERVARLDDEDQILGWVGGGGGRDGTMRLRSIKVLPVLEIEISRDQSLERVARDQSLEIDISGEQPLEISL